MTISTGTIRNQFSFRPIDVAYFCMEFAMADDLIMYSGGLGVLAGDYLHEVETRQAPILGISLLYAFSYHQQISESGDHQDIVEKIHPNEMGLSLIVNDDQTPFTFTLNIADRIIQVQCWVKTVGHTYLFLLDTNLQENQQIDRDITDQLYSGNKEHRLQQEMLLGIGGQKLLQKLGLQPDRYHMNEGHAAFLAFALLGEVQQTQKTDYQTALSQVKQKLVFTNHTLIPAGNDVFNLDLIRIYFEKFALEHNLDLTKLIELGKIPDSSIFSVSLCAMNCAGVSSAVSLYHGQKAKDLWPQYHLIPVTNGVFLPRWISQEINNIWSLDMKEIPHLHVLWEAHLREKRLLLNYVESKTGKTIDENSLIISWARRFVDYKRPKALFWQLDWLENIIKSAPGPIHFLFSGKTHPHDEVGKKGIAEVAKIARSDRFKNNVTFIPDYNLETAGFLTKGSDVWLNTPKEGYEACGTSGMKAGLNGVLQCTTNDGWVREVSWKDIGWILDDNRISESLYEVIENEIIPLYYQRNQDYLPIQWIERMISSSLIIRKNYGTKRMMDDYYQRLYKI